MPVRPVPTALLAACAAAGLVVSAGPASAAGDRATWTMDEPAGATVMQDSSGHGLVGRIGREVGTHVVVAGHTGYAFSHLTNAFDDPPHPEHLITVPDNPLLDPGTGAYAVTITTRFGPSANYRNLMQKGQTGAAGGFFKLEIDRGGVVCLFRGSAGSVSAFTGKINDNAWHTVRCARTASGVTASVDGRVVQNRAGATGTISNSAPLTIGGKPSCASPKVECDYFAGNVDQVSIS